MTAITIIRRRVRLFLAELGRLAQRVDKGEASPDEVVHFGCMNALVHFVVFLIMVAGSAILFVICKNLHP